MSQRTFITLSLLFSALASGYAQLVTKRDYNAAFAAQAGAAYGILAASETARAEFMPCAGLKMTFPFNRKWFLGSEINYNRAKNRDKRPDPAGGLPQNADWEQIAVPLYAKYMLRSNRDMLLAGGYTARLLSRQESPRWDYGFTVGYERLFTRHFAMTFNIHCGVQPLFDPSAGKKSMPFGASLTLSYDILRIGDCGCH